MPANCGSCQAEIDWAVKHPDEINPKNGKLKTTPVNRDSADDPKGNLAVWYDGEGVLRFRYLRKGETPEPGQHRGISHYATCPQADQWRNRG